jgi:hypothetical protein
MGKDFQNYLYMNIGDAWDNRDTNNIRRRMFVLSVEAKYMPSTV